MRARLEKYFRVVCVDVDFYAQVYDKLILKINKYI